MPDTAPSRSAFSPGDGSGSIDARQSTLSWPAALALPGFEADALPFAARTTLALLLAYAVAFFAQVQPASTAGVCVGVLATPSAGMAVSKALYRVGGTALGCIVALCLLSAFPQDRTMLLLGYVAWLALCSCAAALLRDFRSYGAALSGITVAIIAISLIDSPDDAFVGALDRTAAIGIGIAATFAVNLVFGGNLALGKLVADLRTQAAAIAAIGLDALENRPLPDSASLARMGAGLTALRTDATYAAVEQPDGRLRGRAARFTLAALLGCLDASRGLALAPRTGASQAVLQYLFDVAEEVRAPSKTAPAPMPAAPRPTTPQEALLVDRAAEILGRHREAAAGLRALSEGTGRMPAADLRVSYDVVAALLNGARAAIAVSLGACFCVLAGWPGATLLLIQQSALLALLGTAPAPLMNVTAFALPLAPMILATGVVNFLVLPSASGFIPFALVVGPLAFATALVVRSKKIASSGPGALIYLTLLLSPANQETFDLSGFLNTATELVLIVLFTFLAFLVVLPVSPRRRLYRAAVAVDKGLDRARTGRDQRLSETAIRFQLYDRLSRAVQSLGGPRPSQSAFLADVSRLGQAQLALHRTHAALGAAGRAEPCLADAARQARLCLASLEPGPLQEAAVGLLGRSGSVAVQRAAAGMAELALLGSLRPSLARFERLLTH